MYLKALMLMGFLALLMLPEFEAGKLNSIKREKRKLMKFSGVWSIYKWPEGQPIPFIIDDEQISDKVDWAIRQWEERTCIRFQRHYSPINRPGVSFTTGAACSSVVGKQSTMQTITVSPECPRGTLLNLIGTALGFWNEHQRPDRDSYIRINYNNIKPNFKTLFSKLPSEDIEYGLAGYDLGSIMHIGPRTYVNDYDLDSISTVDPAYQNTIGSRDQISFLDAKQINIEYCSANCQSSLSCRNGGYPDPNNCGVCRCPTGLGGTYCDQVAISQCGGELTANNQWQTISSPANNDQCYWRITASGPIELRMDSSDFQCESPCTDYVEVKYSTDFMPTGPRFCCAGALPTGGSWRSQMGEVVVIYKKNASGNNARFSLSYRA